MKEQTSIKNWSEDDRPREKLLLKGTDSLSNAELIAILFSSGNRKESAVDLAKRILHDHENNLDKLGKLSVNDLMKYNGIGEAKAISLMAALELGKRRKLASVFSNKPISSSADIFHLLQPTLVDLNFEEFWVVFLNRANRVIKKQRFSQGGIAGTVIDVRLILKSAIEHVASSLIACHNHPSGNLTASDSDKKITKKLKDAAQIMDMQLLDHIIIAGDQYFSFADNGLMH